MPIQLGVISRRGGAEARGKPPFPTRGDFWGRGGPRAAKVRRVRRPGDDFGAGLWRVPGDVFQKQNFWLADAFPCTTKVAGLESEQISPKTKCGAPVH